VRDDPAREPALTSGRVDMVIATFTYTADRDTHRLLARILQGTGRLLVPNNSSIRSISDLGGKTVATTSGSIYDRWVKNCFKDTKLIVTDSFTNAVIALRDGRADTLMWDDTAVLGIAVTDRNYKLTNDLFLPGPYGIGIKQGNTAMKAWVDSRLNLMKRRDMFFPILRNTVPPPRSPVLEEHPETQADVRLQPGRPHDGVPVAAAVRQTKERPRHARPLPDLASWTSWPSPSTGRSSLKMATSSSRGSAARSWSLRSRSPGRS
jgi:hypothetical protein